MEFFELRPGETIDVAGKATQCAFFTSRSASFELWETTDDGRYGPTGWYDIHWIGDADNGLVHLRFAIHPSLATIRYTNQIRDDLYARLGVPTRTRFKQYVINLSQVVEILDDRDSFINRQVEWDGAPPDVLNMPLFEPPFLPSNAVDRTRDRG